MQQKQDSANGFKLDEFLRMVDVATEIRKKQEEVHRQFSIEEVKEELRQKLKSTAAVSGEKLDDFQIEGAIQSYFEGLYSFKSQKKDFGMQISEIYVERKRLAKKFGIPPLIAASAAGLIWLTATGIHNRNLRSQERAVENAVEIAYQQRQDLLMLNQEILSSPLVDKLPTAEKEKLQSQLSNSGQRLESINPFFVKYCSEGTAEDNVTRENYLEVKGNLENIEESIANSKTEVDEGKSILRIQEDLILTHRNLETLIEEVRDLNQRETFVKKAENIYLVGIGAIERRELKEARQKEQELGEVKNDVINFSGLTSQTESLYASIIAIAKEEEAKEKAKKFYGEAKELTVAADVPELSRAVSQLQDLNSILNAEYTLSIVNRSGAKSGIDRYYTDSRGKRVSGYYLIVEAVDFDGRAMHMNIRNEENGQTERVAIWGERVSQDVYERVKEDKLDNGIINNNVIAKKRRGYLNEDMIMKGVTKQGQITEW